MIDGTSTGTTTDLDGIYTIKNLEPDSYNLVLSYIGYSSKTVTDAEVRAEDVTTVDLALAPAAPIRRTARSMPSPR